MAPRRARKPSTWRGERVPAPRAGTASLAARRRCRSKMGTRATAGAGRGGGVPGVAPRGGAVRARFRGCYSLTRFGAALLRKPNPRLWAAGRGPAPRAARAAATGDHGPAASASRKPRREFGGVRASCFPARLLGWRGKRGRRRRGPPPGQPARRGAVGPRQQTGEPPDEHHPSHTPRAARRSGPRAPAPGQRIPRHKGPPRQAAAQRPPPGPDRP